MRDLHEPVRLLYRLLCSYQQLPESFHGFLLERLRSRFFSNTAIITNYQSVSKDAIFVSSGYLLAYGYNYLGDRQLLGLWGSSSFFFGKSFIRQSFSDLELVALEGAYLLLASYQDLLLAIQQYEGVETLTRMLMADQAETELLRLLVLKERADVVVRLFYDLHPEFLRNGLLLDVDLASYLLIGEQTLRNVRMKLKSEGKLKY